MRTEFLCISVLRVASGPRVKLASCKSALNPPVVYSTDCSKAVVLLVLRLPRLGKRELILVLFVCLFDLCLFGFVGFLFLLVSGKGCGLVLWHSLDFSLTFFLLILVPLSFLPLNTLLFWKLSFPYFLLFVSLKLCHVYS